MVQELAPVLNPELELTLVEGQKELMEVGTLRLFIRLSSYLVMGVPLEVGVFQVNLKSVQEVTT